MKHIAKIILTVLLLPGLSGCEQPSTSDPKEGNEVSVMLEVLSEQLHTTRAIAESDIDDVNIFIYSDTGGLKQHIYACLLYTSNPRLWLRHYRKLGEVDLLRRTYRLQHLGHANPAPRTDRRRSERLDHDADQVRTSGRERRCLV